MAKNEAVLQELLEFLASPVFQAPILTFIEDHCLIFDPAEKPREDHLLVFEKYKKLALGLLDGFREDKHLSHVDLISGVSKFGDGDHLNPFYQPTIEQVLATENFEVFFRLMAQHNIELQQQALVLLLQTIGFVPDSLSNLAQGPNVAPSRPDEDAILVAVIQASHREYEEQQKLRKQEESDLQKVLELSRLEADRLAESRRSEDAKMSSALQKMSVEGGGAAPVDQSTAAATDEPVPRSRPDPKVLSTAGAAPAVAAARVTPSGGGIGGGGGGGGKRGAGETAAVAASLPALGVPPPIRMPAAPRATATAAAGGGGGGGSASEWLREALAETATSGGDAAAADKRRAMDVLEGMSAEELQRRQEFLRQQRDQLIARKKAEREKQLDSYIGVNKSRPKSAARARAAVRNEVAAAAADAPDDRQLAMRRAIAERLKREVINKSYASLDREPRAPEASGMESKKQLVCSIIRFIESEIVSGGLDEEAVESLEIVKQCLESAYGLDAADAADPSEQGLLALFRSALNLSDPAPQPLNPEKAEALKQQGNEFMREQDFQRALTAYTEAIGLDPNQSVFYCNRAAAHLKLLQFQSALADCQQALRLNPTYARAHFRRGQSLSALGRLQEARDAYARAVELEPGQQAFRDSLQQHDDLIRQGAAGPAPPPTSSGPAPAGPMDFGAMLNNPALMNMATQLMSSPNVQSMLSSMMQQQQPAAAAGGAATAAAGGSTGFGAAGAAPPPAQGGGISNLLQIGQQLAQQMQQQNPELVQQLRQQMGGGGGQPPHNGGGEGAS